MPDNIVLQLDNGICRVAMSPESGLSVCLFVKRSSAFKDQLSQFATSRSINLQKTDLRPIAYDSGSLLSFLPFSIGTTIADFVVACREHHSCLLLESDY